MLLQLRLFAIAAILAAPAMAAEILIPGDQPSLEVAMFFAQPGDVLRVQTTQNQASVIVTQPVTILGDPICNIEPNCFWGGIHLMGPGTGSVVLANVNCTFPVDCGFSPSPVNGTGFDEVHVFDSTLHVPNSGQSGLGHGGHGIDVDASFVLVERCSVKAIGNGADDCTYPTYYPENYAGIHAPNATVVVLDSDILGGTPNLLCCELCTCPGTLPPGLGDGGAGIVADEVFLGGSTVSGGEGIDFLAYPGTSGPGSVVCGTYPDGAAVVANNMVTWAEPVTGSGSIQLGQPWTLSYDLPGAMAFLYVGFDVTPPTAALSGFAVIDASSALLVGAVPAGAPNQISINVPNSAALIGEEVGLQFAFQGGMLSKPVLGMFHP